MCYHYIKRINTTTVISCFIVLFWLMPKATIAQSIKKTINTIDSIVNTSLKRDIGVIPAPVFNSTYGNGIAVVPMAIYNHKKFSPETHPSTSQGILYTNFANSYIAGAKQTTYLNHNYFWLDAYVGYASIRYRFYDHPDVPKNDYTEIQYKGFVSNIMALVMVSKYFYVGPIFSSSHLLSKSDLLTGQDEFEWYHIPGIKFSYDSRDDIFYPIHGWLGELSYTKLFDTKLYNYHFDKIKASISNYYSINHNGSKVLASKLYTQLGYGNLPIHEMASPGASPILRGYIPGNYINSSLISMQAEYRWMFAQRWGCVGFGGYGWLFDQPSEIKHHIGLPSVGAGMRYRIFPDFKINMAFDVAFGRNSWNWSFRLSESF
nr:BamA/TamA family outer membrane protein [uncultured Carboxylicivirga sp.]